MKKLINILIIAGTLFTANCYCQFEALNLNMSVGSVQPRFTIDGDSAPFASQVTNNELYPVSFKFNVTITGDGTILGQSNLSGVPTYTCNIGDTLRNLNPFDGAMAFMTSYSGFIDSITAGVMPYHSYEYCVNLVDPSTYTNITTIECYDFTIQTFAAPVLVFPGNTDTLSNHSYRVRFHWHPVSPLEKGPTYYKLTLVPIYSGQTASYAIAHNTPILVQDSLLDSSYSWRPKGDSVIEQTHYEFPVVSYAWQVYAYYTTGTSFGTSSLYSFTIGKVHLNHQGGTFSNTIASENAEMLEFPAPTIPDFDSLQKAAYGSAAPGPWTVGASKTSLCDNGNWEDGNTNNWTPWLGYRDPWANVIVLDTERWDNPGTHSRTDLIYGTSPVYDPRVGGSILPEVWPGGGGHYTMRLGSDNLQWGTDSFGDTIGGAAQAIDYDLALTGTPNVKFWYAVVLQHGGHEYLNQNGSVNYFAESEFMVRVTGYFKTVGPTTSFVKFKQPIDLDSVYGDLHDPTGLTKVVDGPNDTIDYKNWSCKTLYLPATAVDIDHNTVTLAGQTVTLEFLTANCFGGGHLGYAYIDGLCDSSDPTSSSFTLDTVSCPDTSIFANGSASFGAQTYNWIVQQCSSNGDTLFGTAHSTGWIIGQPAIIDLNMWMTSWWQSPFVPGDYYKVKLIVHNDCDDSVIATHEIHIRKLDANAGGNQYLCSSSLHSVTLGGSMTNIAGTTYSWSSLPSGFSSTLPNPSVSPTSTTTYILSVTNSTCSAVDTAIVHVSNPITSANINASATICNGYNLSLTFEPSGATTLASDITWEISGSPPTVIGHGYTQHVSGDTEHVYIAAVTDMCGNTIYPDKDLTANNFNVTDGDEYVICPNGFYPVYGNLNIPEYGLSWGQVPAYGATQYNLQIWNGWGEEIYNHTRNPISGAGFQNGELNWSGRIYDYVNGDSTDAPEDVYLIEIKFYNCLTSTEYWEQWPANFYAPPGCPDTGPPWNQSQSCINQKFYQVTLIR